MADYLNRIGAPAFVETGRAIREFTKPKRFGIPGSRVKLQSNPASIFRFTVPQTDSKAIMKSIISIGGLHIPGRGSIFSQDLLEYNKVPLSIFQDTNQPNPEPVNDIHLLKDLSYVVCVLSGHEAGEQLAKTALDLGVCVPLLTYGTGNDLRDQLGLIRVTISPENEIVHLVMPKQDSDSIIKLLIEDSKLDRPGKGYIYQTPVTLGLIDTRMKVGKQSHAASIDQIIAAIDTLKMGTDWRKRLVTDVQHNTKEALLPENNCEISIISEEDEMDELKEICLKLGVSGAVISKVIEIRSEGDNEEKDSLVRSEMSVSPRVANKVVSALLETRLADKIQLLNSPIKHVAEV